VEERGEEREEVGSLQLASTQEPKNLMRETSEPYINGERLTTIRVG